MQYIVKAELAAFADGLNVGVEKAGSKGDPTGLGASCRGVLGRNRGKSRGLI